MTDLILSGAEVRSAPFARALGRKLLVRNGRFAAVGAEPDPRGARQSEVIELDGGCLLPGFVDAHVHFRALVRRRRSLDCSDAATAAELLARLSRAATTGAGWLFAHGLEHRRPGFGNLPERTALDRVVPGRPLWLRHRSGHLSLLNSAALRELGWIDSGPPQGLLERREGRPTGALYGAGTGIAEWLRAHQPEPAADEVAAAAGDLLRRGVTAFADLTASNRAEDLPKWTWWHAEGTLPQCVSLWVAPDSLAGRSRFRSSEPVRLGGIKLMLEPALGGPSVEVLAVILSRAARGGWPVAVHCAEEEAVLCALEAQRLARNRPPYAPPSMRLEHVHSLSPPVQAELREAGLPVCVQPGQLWELGDLYSAMVPAQEQPWLFPLASLDAAAAGLAIGSDAPAAPLDPLRHAAAAVFRRDRAGRTWNPGERLGVERALTAVTRDAARLSGFEGQLGEIACGRRADAVYLPLEWPELRAALERGEAPEPAGVLAGGRWHSR